jgi:predicted ester cyclase
VVVRSTARGTHEAEFEGIPATGNTIEYGQIVIFRLIDGLIVEAWIQEDNLTMMSQLGLNLAPSGSGS